ncbi:NAD(P)H-dependent anabolic L-arginine dehydrogenase DauB [Aureimonas sp. SA4125]|uniref:ornithine cyclodeaminase family protein n=1 Tax=Aureimonas sp. SA4125 TaxID=2826993 RepID=UPI001CC52AD2|nr:ornithine cyclodeaminase family protein [Aureimonas sp. SA4125]BDA87002.1 NAD(P)H-dependent anabolic L-arginine dehydrogenase DauB [Aureimonas sp. SA4125]
MTIQPPMVFDDAAIQSIIGKIDMRTALVGMFRALAGGSATQPAQTLSLFPHDGGDFITYLGVLASEKVFGAKLSPYIPGDGKALVTAWTVLMSMETGAPLLLCDSKRLTTERTAATTALAVDLLARKNAGILTVVGTGAVGLAHLRHAEGVRPWREVRLCSPSAGRKPGLPDKLADGTPVVTFTDADKAASGADVVMLCTSSGTPVIDVGRLPGGVLVTSISTNVANAREIDPAALSGLDVYCDYRATTPASAGEMKLAAAAGTWSADCLLGDLPELVTGRATLPSRTRPAFFRSIGLGLEDIAAAAAVLAAART